MATLNKLGQVLLALLVLLTGALQLFPIKVASAEQAAAETQVSEDQVRDGTFRWINRSTIVATFGTYEFTFFDGDIGDSTQSFKVQEYAHHGTIDLKKDGNGLIQFDQAVLDFDPLPPGTVGVDAEDIGDINITIGSIDAAQIYYVLKEDATFVRVDGRTDGDNYIFKQDATRPNLYLREDDGDGCVDRALLYPDSKTYSMWVLDKGDPPDENPAYPADTAIGTNCVVKSIGYDNWILGAKADAWPTAPDSIGCEVSCIWTSTFAVGSGQPTWPHYMLASDLVGISLPDLDGDGTGSGEIELNCEFSFLNPLTWLMCPLVEGASHAASMLDNAINDQLTVPIGDGESFDEDSQGGAALYQTWSSMRTIALSLLVVIGVIMVISQAAAAGPFDAYTVKKVMPRIIIAAIAITLSWQLCKLLIGLSNDAGQGIGALIAAPLSSLPNPTLSGTGQSVGFIGAIAGFFSGIDLIVILSLVLTALAGLLVAFVVITFRNIMIMLLVILSPVAITFWILPNTEKAWGFWKTNFGSMLLAFPIITGFIAAGRMFAKIASIDTGVNGIAKDFIIFIAYFGPYFALPAAFRLAGGALAQVGGIANDRTRGFFDKRKAKRQERMAYKHERRWTRPTMQLRANTMRRMESRASGMGKVGGAITRFGARQIGGPNMEAAMSAKNAEVAKEINDQIATGKDDDIRGLTVNKTAADAYVKQHGWEAAEKAGIARIKDGKRQYQSLGGAWVDEANVLNGHKRWGNDRFAQQAALSYEMRKAMTNEQVGNIGSRYNALAKEWGMSDSEAGGAWIGAAFENQNQHLEFKGMDWKTGGLNNDGQNFVDEVYEKKGSYQLSQMSAHQIRQLHDTYGSAQSTIDSFGGRDRASLNDTERGQLDRAHDLQRKIKSISETFVQQGGVTGMAGEGDAAVPITGRGGGGVSAPGSAHVNEEARRLAELTGAVTPPSGTGPTRRPPPSGGGGGGLNLPPGFSGGGGSFS